MKKLFLFALIVAMAAMAGCSTLTNAVYGPDLTPDQLKDAIYMDAYSVAQIRMSVAMGRTERGMRANGATADEIKTANLKFIDEVQGRIALVKQSTDPMSLLNQYWYKMMAEADPDRTAVMALAGLAGRRVLKRIGISISGDGINQQFEAIGFNKDLFLWAVGAYEQAVADIKAGIS